MKGMNPVGFSNPEERMRALPAHIPSDVLHSNMTWDDFVDESPEDKAEMKKRQAETLSKLQDRIDFSDGMIKTSDNPDYELAVWNMDNEEMRLQMPTRFMVYKPWKSEGREQFVTGEDKTLSENSDQALRRLRRNEVIRHMEASNRDIKKKRKAGLPDSASTVERPTYIPELDEIDRDGNITIKPEHQGVDNTNLGGTTFVEQIPEPVETTELSVPDSDAKQDTKPESATTTNVEKPDQGKNDDTAEVDVSTIDNIVDDNEKPNNAEQEIMDSVNAVIEEQSHKPEPKPETVDEEPTDDNPFAAGLESTTGDDDQIFDTSKLDTNDKADDDSEKTSDKPDQDAESSEPDQDPLDDTFGKDDEASNKALDDVLSGLI